MYAESCWKTVVLAYIIALAVNDEFTEMDVEIDSAAGRLKHMYAQMKRECFWTVGGVNRWIQVNEHMCIFD